ncbi:MAG TPA: UDP-4-amino-4,6-dideoxy-N-acetyl-beta-L-altrosamine transaminase [Lentisphaeria bacterium]|nr:MAG: UDP-4-amino-4,6-dideoxy-N-acetyl-beta-L-altrosamine transaminase [Lentisphaerae bacterium GWF2_50_93]HCE45591.1 UDP-4-amino-4,6-dideoxy-N-acetyl-beta-L-altrosamine transaminase [Lentisphaeria bacterium]
MNKNFINYHRPAIGREEIKEVISCLKSGWLTTGMRTKQFEADFAKYADAKFAVALNSCTAALHLALEAIGLKEGDLVIVPTMTFAATAEVVRYFNAIPVLVDVNEKDFCINLDHAEETIRKIKSGKKVACVPARHNGIKAIIPVHYGGQPYDVNKCRRLCKKHGLFLIEDCAHVCPAHYKDEKGKWQYAGKGADIACYSFYANKTITTGEGGMATTENEKWADRMRIMSLHGISKDAWKRFTKSGTWYYEIVAPGYKYNLTDIGSSLGIHQLKKADKFMAERKRLAEMYGKALKGIPGIILPKEKPDTKHSWHLYVIRIDSAITGIHRNEAYNMMKEAGIGCSVHYIPLHMHPYYREKYGLKNGDFPVAEKLFDQCLSLPIFPGLKKSEFDRICTALKKILGACR